MSKRKWLITGVLIVFLLLLGVIAYWFFWPEEYYEEVHDLKQTFSGNPVKEMKIGESYEVEDMVFQMVDETHFVYTIDYSGYANQKELEDTRWIMISIRRSLRQKENTTGRGKTSSSRRQEECRSFLKR